MLSYHSINDCPCVYLFCLLSLHRECVYNSVLVLHIDTTALSDGTYELIQEPEGGDPEVQVNAAELTEAPNQSSEEPKAEIVSNYREGKPRT